MPAFPRVELQRILARGSGSLCDDVLIDVEHISNWLERATTSASGLSPVWDDLARIAARSHRRFLWLYAPKGREQARIDTMLSRVQRVAGSLGPVLLSEESLPSLVRNSTFDGGEVSVVSADVEQDAQLQILNWGVASVLDIATGVSWQYRPVGEGPATTLGEPFFLPVLDAVTHPRPHDRRGRPLGGRRAPEARDEMDRALRTGPIVWEPSAAPLLEPDIRVVSYTKAAIGENYANIEARTRELSGVGVEDSAARRVLADWSRKRIRIDAPAPDQIVVGTVTRDREGNTTLTDLWWYEDGSPRRAITDGTRREVLSRLARDRGARWIAPRALDLAGCMVDGDLPLPERIVDPGIQAFVLDPDSSSAVVERLGSASLLEQSSREWLFDVKRKTPVAFDPKVLVESLPSIHRELETLARERGLASLVDSDLGTTLPVLARIERTGAWIGTPAGGWEALRSRIEVRLEQCEGTFDGYLLGLDPYRSDVFDLVWALSHTLGRLPDDQWSPVMGHQPSAALARYARASPVAKALQEARSLGDALAWIATLEGARRARPLYTPQVGGRWSTSSPNLIGVPKHSWAGKEIRSALTGPPGTVLVGADFSSFEVRLLADLSGDPILRQAAREDDAIAFMASRYFGGAGYQERQLMKRSFYALNYGQRPESFAADLEDLPVPEALALHSRISDDLPGVFRLRDRVAEQLRAGVPVITAAGWQRRPLGSRHSDKVLREAFSTLVQGTGADIVRFVLRELDRELRRIGGVIVHQAHDEIYVAVAPEHVAECAATMKSIMTAGVMERSGLVSSAIRIVVSGPKTGRSWRDLI